MQTRSTPPDRQARVLGFGTYDARLHPRIAVLLEGLRRRGFRVTELNLPLGMSTADKVRALKQPWLLPVYGGRLLSRWASLARGALRFTGTNRPEHVLVGYMGHFDVLLAALLFPRSTVILDHLIFASGTALDRGTKQGLKTRLLNVLDGMAMRAADIIVTDTEEHRQLVPESLRSRAVVTQVGAPSQWFEARPISAGRGTVASPLRVIFYGLFTPLQGTDFVAEAIHFALTRGANLEVTLVGDGQDASRAKKILREDAVTWIPWVESEALPQLVAEHDVSLGIFGTTSKAQAVIPNKVFQGAAAGCAIVTSDTAPQRRVLGDDVLLVPPGDAHALADALTTLAAHPDRVLTFRELGSALADAEFSSERVVGDLAMKMKEHS